MPLLLLLPLQLLQLLPLLPLPLPLLLPSLLLLELSLLPHYMHGMCIELVANRPDNCCGRQTHFAEN